MAYTKTTWRTDDVITAPLLNKMEHGIYDASEASAQSATQIQENTDDIAQLKSDLSRSLIKFVESVSAISTASSKKLYNVNDNVILNTTSTYWDDTPTGAGGTFINIRYSSSYNQQFYIENATGNRYDRVVKRDGTIYRAWTAIITKAQYDTLNTDSITYIDAIATIASQSNNLLANINDNVVLNGSPSYFNDTPTGKGGSFVNIRYTSGYNEQLFFENATGHKYERVVSRTGTIYRGWTLDTRSRFINKKVYCTGDSIMWGRTDADGRASLTIPNNIASRYPVSVTNSAVGGDTITHRSDNASVYDRITQVDLSSYDYVVINGGTNDYGMGSAMGTKDSTDVNTFYGSYKAILEYIFSENPYMRVMLITPTYRNYVAQGETWHYGNGYEMNGDGGYTLDDVCEAIIEIGKMYGVPVFDSRHDSPINSVNYQTTLELTSGSTDRYLHPSDDSYKLYGDSIASFFGKVF